MRQTTSLNQRQKLAGENRPEKLSSQDPSPEALQQENETLSRELATLRGQILVQSKQSEAAKKQLFNELEVRVKQARVLALLLVLAEQQERGRIARLLYSDLRQLLYSLMFRLEVLNLQSPTSGLLILTRQFNKIIQSVNQAIDLTRILIGELDPPGLRPEGSERALPWLVMHMKEGYNFNIDLSIRSPYRLDNQNTQALLLQIVHELLLNIISHTDTRQARIDLCQEAETVIVQITVADIGFDPEQFQARSKKEMSAGLFNIQNWLELRHGRLEIDSKPDQDAQITIFLPT